MVVRGGCPNVSLSARTVVGVVVRGSVEGVVTGMDGVAGGAVSIGAGVAGGSASVRASVAGVWASVTWEKLKSCEEAWRELVSRSSRGGRSAQSTRSSISRVSVA